MDNMRINGGLSLFKKITVSKENKKVSNSNSTNPFGLSFKGKAQTGDLFVKSPDNFKNSIKDKGKMVVSAVVGSLVEIKNTFAQKFEPIITFAKETGQKISQIADKIGSFDASSLKISNLVKSNPYPGISKEAKKLISISPDDAAPLEAMWHAHLAQV